MCVGGDGCGGLRVGEGLTECGGRGVWAGLSGGGDASGGGAEWGRDCVWGRGCIWGRG